MVIFQTCIASSKRSKHERIRSRQGESQTSLSMLNVGIALNARDSSIKARNNAGDLRHPAQCQQHPAHRSCRSSTFLGCGQPEK